MSRLELVKNLIKPEINPPTDLNLANDNEEESLRKLMVIIIPKIKRELPDPLKVDIFFSLIYQMKTPAMTDDYRFLDLWNHGYEAILKWENVSKEHDVQYFLLEYMHILNHHIKML